MALLALLGFTAFGVASLVVGARLLGLARRTGLLPEKLIGASLFLAGGLGTFLLLLSGAGWLVRGGLTSAAMLAIDLGITVLGVFTWRVFRPGLLGATLVATCTCLVFLSLAADLVAGHYLGVHRSGFSIASDYTGRLVLYGWASYETLRQYLLARRRVRLGLTDPLVANRFLLWGTGTLAALGLWLYSLAVELTGSADRTEFYLVATVLGGTCALVLWLAFFPPDAYRRWFAVDRP